MEPSEHEKDKVERLRRTMYSRSLSDKLKDRERRPLEAPNFSVGNEFVEPQEHVAGVVVAPRTIGLMRSALWWFLGGAVIFFIGAILYFGYYFLAGGGSLAAPPSNINIVISGPPQIEGGTPAELQITVTNKNKVPLELADLVITYPSGTRSPTDFATTLQSQRIPLGTIEAGGTRQGTVSAVFAGGEGDHANVKVELEYRIQGTSAIFVAESDYAVVYSSSSLSLAVDGNNETISGQPVEFTISVTSNANAPVRDVLLTAQYPFGFKFSSAAPPPTSGMTWQLGDFAPGQKRTITVRGSLSGEEGDERVFHFIAGTRDNTRAASGTIETTLANNAFRMSISESFLGLAVTVNGAKGSSVIVSPGDNVSIAIAWQNNLPTAIVDAVIAARLSGFEIDGSTVHSTDGFYRSNDTTIIWDKTTSGGALANLIPGARGTIGFTFQMPKGDALKNILKPRLEISINAAGKRLSETGVPENLQSTVSQKIALASDLALTAQGLYYANPFGSVGPMPPKAGTETTYALVFTVTNTTNKITDAKVTAHLPPYVRWVGIYSPSTERITFNQNDGTMTWSLGDIAPGVGLNGTPPRQLAIAVGFTPSTSQIGQQPPLLQNIQLSGIDPSKADVVKEVDPGAVIPRTVLKADADITTNLLQIAKTSKDAATVGTDPGFSAAISTVVK